MDIRKSIRKQYLKFLDREPDLDDLDYYFDELKNNRIKLDDLIIILKNSNEYKELSKNQKTPQSETSSIDTYNDIRIKGKTHSLGYRNSEKRYAEILYGVCCKSPRGRISWGLYFPKRTDPGNYCTVHIWALVKPSPASPVKR